MIKTDWESGNKVTYVNLNEIITEIKNLYLNLYGIELTDSPIKNNGDFFYAEDSKWIEDKLKYLTDLQNIYYDYKNYYNITSMNYIDLNKWGQAITNISNELYYLLYPSNDLYPSDDLYPGKIELTNKNTYPNSNTYPILATYPKYKGGI
jgi:two-component SAPR family response regulator